MYLEYFGLLEAPFSIAPDPRYLYMSERHREALAHLLYGLNSDGAFILLSGDVGTGKTTVSRCLLEQVPENTDLALLLNPKLSATELLQVICDELGITYAQGECSVKSLVDHINRYLLENHARGRKTVVLIEEAQNLDLDVLEQLRLLTNLETSERKLLQVILLGQPELLDILDRPELSQLAQRITARFHLSPLNSDELAEYIGHRLAVAGCRRALFGAGVIRQLYQYSGGVPRLINVICDRALLGCFVQGSPQVDATTLNQAATEVLGEQKMAVHNRNGFSSKWPYWLAASLLVGCLLLLGVLGRDYLPLTGEAQQVSVDVGQQKPVQELVADTMESENAAAPTPTPEPVPLINWPGHDERLRSNFQAYEALFRRWQLDYEHQIHGTPCFYAQTQGLACLHDETTLQGLRGMNHPAILKLYDDFNQPQYVALLALGDSEALINMAGRQQQVSLKQLELYWRGEFSMLWRNPLGEKEVIKPGNEGALVVWLSKVMNTIYNTPQKSTSSYYDADLVDRVRQFQLNHGLDDDGVVGVKTLIHINRVTGQYAPGLENNS